MSIPTSSIDRILEIIIQNLKENFTQGVTFDKAEPYVNRKVNENISIKKVTVFEGEGGLQLVKKMNSDRGEFKFHIIIRIEEKISTDKNHRSDLNRFRSAVISHILRTDWNTGNSAIIKHIDGTNEDVGRDDVIVGEVYSDDNSFRTIKYQDKDPKKNYSNFVVDIEFKLQVIIGESIWEPREGEAHPAFSIGDYYPNRVDEYYASGIVDPPKLIGRRQDG